MFIPYCWEKFHLMLMALVKPNYLILYCHFSKDRNKHSKKVISSTKCMLIVCNNVCCYCETSEITNLHQKSKPGMLNNWHPMNTSIIKVCCNAACFMWIHSLHQIAAGGMWLFWSQNGHYLANRMRIFLRV